jgi:hypothetical protein
MKKNREIIQAILLYVITTALITYPVIFYLNSKIFAQAGDPYSSIFNFWQYASQTSKINYFFPEHSLYRFYSNILSRLTNEVFTYNFIIFFACIFSALSFYFIVKHLTKNHWIGLIGGLIAILLPYRFAQSLQHLNLANIGFLGFFIYFLLKSRQKANYKNVILAGIFFTLTTLDSYIYGLFAGIILIIYLAIIFIIKLAKKEIILYQKSILPILTSCAIVCVIVGYFTYPFWSDIIGNNQSVAPKSLPKRSLHEIEVYSSYAGYYFLPSPDNPLFGKFTEKYFDEKVNSLGTNRTEQINYLGYTLIFLAIVYLIYFFKNYKHIGKDRKFATYLFLTIGLIGFYLSFSYRIYLFGTYINPLPEKISEIVLFFRVYSRLSLLASIGLIFTACLGLEIMANNIKHSHHKYFFFAMVLLLLLVEFLIIPKDTIQQVDYQSMPQVYKEIDVSDCYIIEYPLIHKDSPNGYIYLLWNRLNGCKLFNREYKFIENGEEIRKSIRNINEDNILDIKNLGISHIIIHKDKFLNDNIMGAQDDYLKRDIPNLLQIPKLEKIGEWENKELYSIR